MNRFDERHPRFWRHERERDETFRDGDPRFERSNDSGRTAGDAEHQPFSGNPYGYYPGQGRTRREPEREWPGRESREFQPSGHPYGQREPYNARGGSRRSRWGGPWNDEGSRYSESQYGMRRSRFEPYGDRYEPQFGEGPFADTSESPGYFGSGNYGDGGASYTGGFDQRYRTRYPGSLGEDTFSSGGSRRYRTGPKGYTRSDERIREDISERLMLADSIDSSEVSISVKEGKVTLEGTVPTRSMKHSIEDLADYTAGVTDVDNRIRVDRPGATPSSSNVQSVPTKTTKQ
jgi:hypothetical protein